MSPSANKKPASKPKKETTKKSQPTKRSKGGAVRGRSSAAAAPASPFTTSANPNIRYALSAWCMTAEEVEEQGEPYSVDSKQNVQDPDYWHEMCPIATLQESHLRARANGDPELVPERITICISDWHHKHARCWVCRGRADDGIELDPERRNCVDLVACSERAQIRLEQHPGYERWKQFTAAVDERKAQEAQNGDTKPRAPRKDRPTSGRCEHCGEPTKGGRFVAGHDAKLKGQLIREAAEGDINAVAEAMARNWYKPGRFPDLEDAAFAIVQATETETLIQQRTTERLGE